MNLDNARQLKASVLQTLATEFNKPSFISALGIRARATSQLGALRTVAIGISPQGKQNRLAIRVQRRLLEDHPQIERIKKRAKGEVDIRFVGKLQKLETPAALQKQRRPLVIGCSIGHFKITAGTLGCFVKQRSTGDTVILSNNHVLANENDATLGDAILQQGSIDGGRRTTHRIGKLAGFVKLKTSVSNRVDCAIASITTGIAIRDRKLGSFGNLAGLGAEVLAEGLPVRKVGRTTGETKGKVTAFELDNVVVGYDVGNVEFDDQIEIEGAGTRAFSDGGDSGSLIFDAERLAVGLLFAGSESGGSNNKGLTYANPIRAVLDALKIDLLT